MKREIKFRGKKIDGKWIYGFLAYIEDKPAIIYGRLDWVDGTELRGDDWDWVNPDTVCQYTGLKDRTDKCCIYEGDIVKWETCVADYRFGELITEVYYDEKSASFEPLGEYCFEKFEVIGNIYDNPELLED